MRRLIFFTALLAATPIYADTPGKVRKIVRQDGGGGGGASFTGDLAGNTLTDSVGTLTIQPSSGQTLVLNEDDGAAALTIDTVGNATFGFPIVSQSASVSIDGAGIDLSDVDSITWSSGAFYSNTDDTFLTRAEANVLRLDGDGSGTTAGRLAVSGIAPMSSSTGLSVYSADGTTAMQVNNSNNIHFQQATWNDSLGAITHLLGPSDQSFTLRPGSGQTLVLNEDGGTAALTVQTDGIVVGASTVRGAALQTSSFTFTASASAVDTTVGLDMNDTDITGANVIQPTTGQTLVLAEDGGAASLTVETDGDLTLANGLQINSQYTNFAVAGYGMSAVGTNPVAVQMGTGSSYFGVFTSAGALTYWIDAATSVHYGGTAADLQFRPGAGRNLDLMEDSGTVCFTIDTSGNNVFETNSFTNQGTDLTAIGSGAFYKLHFGAGDTTTGRLGLSSDAVISWGSDVNFAVADSDTTLSRGAETRLELKGDGGADASFRVYEAATASDSWTEITHDGTDGRIGVGSGDLVLRTGLDSFRLEESGGQAAGQITIDRQITLTDNVASTLFTVSLPADEMVGGTVEVLIKVIGTAGTEFQVAHDIVSWVAANDSGSYTTDVRPMDSGGAVALDAGASLARTYAITTGTNEINVRLTANSDLTVTSMVANFKVYTHGDNTVTIP